MTDTPRTPSTGIFGLNRREFLRTTASAAVAASVAGRFGMAHAQGSDEIRVGLIGAGGRGTGALRNVLDAAPGVRVVAIGDVFQDRIDSALESINAKLPKPLDVPRERQFTGLDAYKEVLKQDINYVILATPPGFRPQHLKAAVDSGKHIFTEKPVAVDGPGVRDVLALADVAAAKGLHIAAGTQRRHQAGYIETMQRIHDGAIGDIVAARAYWNQGALWHKPRQPGWSDAEWMLRNWLYFPFLSGDIIVEQHIHNPDVIHWAMQAHPVSAVSLAGRQVRTQPEFGNVYDHFATDYEYENGVHLMSMCRQIDNCANNISEALVGTRGNCQVDRYTITGANPWKRADNDDEADPYVQEHTDLIAAIRGGTPLNELKTVAETTLAAIMGRMAGYTGQLVTWDEALNSQEVLMPKEFSLESSIPVPPVAMPGQTPLT
jgi:myo-inositol 2-dehydrogenase/D-chiro-inositol 1-dehydrogenase